MHSPGNFSDRRGKTPAPQKPIQSRDDAPPFKPYFGEDFQPLHDLLLAECKFVGQQGAIIIPDSVQQTQQTAVVVRTGPGRMLDNGTIRPPCVKAGDWIFCDIAAGFKTKIGDRFFVILNSSQVWGTFPTPPEDVMKSEADAIKAAQEAKAS